MPAGTGGDPNPTGTLNTPNASGEDDAPDVRSQKHALMACEVSQVDRTRVKQDPNLTLIYSPVAIAVVTDHFPAYPCLKA